jgi:hypothetical protein
MPGLKVYILPFTAKVVGLASFNWLSISELLNEPGPPVDELLLITINATTAIIITNSTATPIMIGSLDFFFGVSMLV